MLGVGYVVADEAMFRLRWVAYDDFPVAVLFCEFLADKPERRGRYRMD